MFPHGNQHCFPLVGQHLHLIFILDNLSDTRPIPALAVIKIIRLITREKGEETCMQSCALSANSCCQHASSSGQNNQVMIALKQQEMKVSSWLKQQEMMVSPELKQQNTILLKNQ
eukprot:12678703-Ditylum_brightwellii.AAC.1